MVQNTFNQQNIEIFRKDLEQYQNDYFRKLCNCRESVIDVNKSVISALQGLSALLLIIGLLPPVLILYLFFRLSLPFIAMLPIIIVIFISTIIYSHTLGLLGIYLIVISANKIKIILSLKEFFNHWFDFLKQNLKSYIKLELFIVNRILIDFLMGFIPSFILINIIPCIIFGFNFLFSYVFPSSSDIENRIFFLFKIFCIVISLTIGLIRALSYLNFSPFISFIYLENKLSGTVVSEGDMLSHSDKLVSVIGTRLLIKYNLFSIVNFYDFQVHAYFYCFYHFVNEEIKKRGLI